MFIFPVSPRLSRQEWARGPRPGSRVELGVASEVRYLNFTKRMSHVRTTLPTRQHSVPSDSLPGTGACWGGRSSRWGVGANDERPTWFGLVYYLDLLYYTCSCLVDFGQPFAATKVSPQSSPQSPCATRRFARWAPPARSCAKTISGRREHLSGKRCPHTRPNV